MKTCRASRAATADQRLAVAYLRVSTEEQSLGVDAQRSAIESWAIAKGVTLISTHEDRLSGATPAAERPGLLAALEALRANRGGILVAAKRDRLARDVVVAATIERLAMDAGARVVTADGVNAEDTPEGALLRGLMDSFAQYERAVIRARTTAALAVKKARGERVSRRAPVGYRFEGSRVIEDEGEQRLLARARDLRAKGLSYQRVVDLLTAEGARLRGGRLHVTTLVRVLA